MRPNELTESDKPELARALPCVVIAAARVDDDLRLCLDSTLAHTAIEVPIVIVSAQPATELHGLLAQYPDRGHTVWLAPPRPPTSAQHTEDNELTAALDHTISLLSPSDIALLSEPARVTAGWLKRLQSAAHADTNTASASALAAEGTSLALADAGHPAGSLADLAERVAQHTMTLRPRLGVAVGPCIYLRRDALELVGCLDTRLDLGFAVAVDLAQRCLLAGLAHVAADDVLVEGLASKGDDLPMVLQERYPYLPRPIVTAASGVLPRALEAARRPRSRLWVTIDARALGTAITGTQRHILELIKALATTENLRLRLVVSADTSAANRELLGALPQTELLHIESIEDSTPRSTIFHRPQQVFGPADMRLALRLGERIVLNQLDLIAYRNPGYHANAVAWHSHRRVSRQALAGADRVIVFSSHTRSELLSDELADAQRIRVIPPGLDHPSPTNRRRPAALEQTDDPSPVGGEGAAGFLLCLGTDFRHKNRVFALRLLAALRNRHGWRGKLMLAGTHIPPRSSLEIERSFLERHRELGGVVHELGAIDEEEKAWLMAHAAAVVYPSVYEGFGLVPFEAALSGVPCVFAPQSSLAEVLPPDAATIVPWSPEESADRTHTLLTDPTARARHIAAVLAPARHLTWAAAATKMVEAYREAVVAPVREAVALSRDEVEREQELQELTAAHDELVATLARERDHARRTYDELNADVGFGLSLIGPNGALPEDVQRALLALTARPALSGPAFGVAGGAFRAVRRIASRKRGG
jgi:glycosyltransferase involved in cell wall biosynthesis